MKQKILFCTLLWMLAAILPAHSETLTVYDGTTTNNYVPIYGYYCDAYLKCEFVIPASELADMNKGTITGLTWYLKTPASTSWGNAHFQVFVKEVDSETISTFSGTNGATMVYEGSIDGTQSTININFTNNYAYKGGNLLIGVYNTVKGSYSSQTTGLFYGVTVNNSCVQGYASNKLSGVSPTQRNFIPKTTFTYEPKVKKPTNLTASNVVYNGATLAWTPGDANQNTWQVVYGTGNNFNPNTATPTDVTGQPTKSLTSLAENTTYTAYVRAKDGDGDVSAWSSCTFTTPERYPRPTNLAVDDITAYNAKASWDGVTGAQSYNLRYRKVLSYSQSFFESFENGLSNWTLYDNDGDGNNWTQFNPNNFSSGGFAAYDGSYTAMSRSWYNNTALTPDNWLVSPSVNLGGVLKYYIHDDGADYPETYRIYVSTTGTDIADFTPVTDDLLSPNSSEWVERMVDLSAYEGQQGYIAFRNYNCTDRDFMLIDAISINALTYGEWVVANNVTSPYAITGLEAETEYIVEVQAVYAEGSSNWTSYVDFTTLGADAMPASLTVANETDRTAEASWIGSQDNYNLRYRKLYYYENFENGLPSDWTTIDNDGDGYNWTQVFDECISSASYMNNVGALTPDNWLITPKMALEGQLSFDAWGQDSGDYAEVFRVYVSTTGTAVGDFTAISQDITTTNDQTSYTFDLSSYAGQEGYIAIRHYNVTNMFWLNVKHFNIIGGNWTTINNVTSPHTIPSLEAETLYEVQVQGVLENGTTDWTKSTYFTTLEQLDEYDLESLVDECVVGRKYRITDGDLAAVYVSNDGKTLYCKDNNKYAAPNTLGAGQIDYIAELTNLMSNRSYDQSNWVALRLQGEGSLASLKGKVLNNVVGTLNNKANPELLLGAIPSSNSANTYTPNTFIVPSFGTGTQTSSAGVTYFFVTPKPMEVATVTWAMWDGEKFVSPPKNEHINQAGLTGSINVDFSLYNGTAPTLQNGDVCTFTAIINKSVAGPSDAQAHRAPGDVSYSAYALDDFAKIGSIVNGVVTGINDVKANSHEVMKVVYSNAAGQVSDRPFEGVNIVVTIYDDGSREVAKKIYR